MTTDMELVDMPSPSAKDDSSVLIELDSDNENCNPAKKRKLDENAAVKTPRTAKKQKEEDKERLKRKEEQQRKREEEKRKKEEEKKRKEEEKEEEKRKREEEKRKKEEEKRIAAEEKRKEKEEKEARLRKEKEEKEARRREEQEEKLRKKKEEEDRKDQKRREEEEMLKKKQRQSERFLKFFNKPIKEAPPTVSVEPHSKFKPFQIKGGMRLAPLHVRTALTDEEKANLLQIHLEKSDYISTAKLKKPYRKRKVAINNGKGKFKLFQFHDNYRPPYYGTFSKKRRTVSGRRPFKAEPTINYDYNSDEEWECDVAEGEECDSHDEEDNEKEEEVDEENDGFFVDHGYLSDGEGSNPKAANETEEERKRRRAQHATEWKEIQKSKSKRYTQRNLQPNMYGPTWIAPEEGLVPHHIFRHLLPGVLFKY